MRIRAYQRHIKKCLIGLCLIAGVFACAIDTIPLPEIGRKEKPTMPGAGEATVGDEAGNSPEISGSATIIDARAVYYATDPILLVGAEKAVPGTGLITVTNPSRPTWTGQVASRSNGSFVLLLNAAVGETVYIYYSEGGLEKAILPLELTASSSLAQDFSSAVTNTKMQRPSTGDPGTSTPSALIITALPQGKVSVSAPASVLPAGITILIANTSLGSATQALVLPNGSVHVELEGSSGHELSIFGVPANESHAGDAAITFVVP